jgi:hypothetical protein
VLTETYALHRKRLGTKYGLLLCLGCNLVWDLSGWGGFACDTFSFSLVDFHGSIAFKNLLRIKIWSFLFAEKIEIPYDE